MQKKIVDVVAPPLHETVTQQAEIYFPTIKGPINTVGGHEA